MEIKIGLIGAGGRMGKAIAALQTPFMEFGKSTPISNECDLFIDVSLPDALLLNLPLIEKPIVIGMTGLTEKHFKLIEEKARTIPIFYSPNFSLGMALMRKAAGEIAKKFHDDAYIDLIETHHAEKRDAPSGAALALAKEIGKPVNIHSIRSGKIVAEHTLMFNTAEERITISHQAHNRSVFARGALQAARYLMTKPPGLYGMDNLI